MLPNINKEERSILIALGPSNVPQTAKYISEETGIGRGGVHVILARMKDAGLLSLSLETLPADAVGLREPRRLYCVTDAARMYLLPADFLQACREECVRSTLTSVPLKFQFLAQRNMRSLDDVHDWMQKTRTKFVELVSIYGGNGK